MSSPVLLILGAGPGIGKHVAQAFAAKGYRVALTSRTARSVDGGQIHITADLSHPEQVAGVFETVQKNFNAAPSVVVYNAYVRITDNRSDPLANFSLSTYHNTFATNNTSVILAMQQAILGFRTLPTSASKTFIMTGNMLNLITLPEVLTFGMAKTATAHAIRNLVEHETYKKEGVKFYWADERTMEGAPVLLDISGPVAAVEYVRLAELEEQGPWMNTHVKGKGYVDFSDNPWTLPKLEN